MWDVGADGCIPGRDALRTGADGQNLQSFLLHQGQSGVQLASGLPLSSLLPKKPVTVVNETSFNSSEVLF